MWLFSDLFEKKNWMISKDCRVKMGEGTEESFQKVSNICVIELLRLRYVGMEEDKCIIHELKRN